jgi:hypothetical protein
MDTEDRGTATIEAATTTEQQEETCSSRRSYKYDKYITIYNNKDKSSEIE